MVAKERIKYAEMKPLDTKEVDQLGYTAAIYHALIFIYV